MVLLTLKISVIVTLLTKAMQVQFECRRLAQAFSYTDISVDKFTISKICGELCEADNVQDYADKMLLLQLIDGYFVSQ